MWQFCDGHKSERKRAANVTGRIFLGRDDFIAELLHAGSLAVAAAGSNDH
jgi:hypothetical protein